MHAPFSIWMFLFLDQFSIHIFSLFSCDQKCYFYDTILVQICLFSKTEKNTEADYIIVYCEKNMLIHLKIIKLISLKFHRFILWI